MKRQEFLDIHKNTSIDLNPLVLRVTNFDFVSIFAMTAEAPKKSANPEADAKNWEQRLKSEQEAPHKWNEAWGSLFNNGVPHDYKDKIEYYKGILHSKPPPQVPPKYGVGAGFKEIGNDHRRKKMFQDPIDDDDY